jgi:tetratricopeptide (TPR) repeat protein
MKKIRPIVLPLMGLCVLSLLAGLVVAGDTPPPLPPLKLESPRPFSPDKATTPQTQVFYYMRGLSGSSSLTLDELRSNILRYRTLAQDRKRRGLRADDWVAPDEFRRHREVYTQLLKDAADALHPKDTHTGTHTPPVGTGSGVLSAQAKQKKNEAACLQKLDKAAQSWPDAAFRNFLMGLAYLQSTDAQGKKDKLGAAESAFKDCCNLAPRVAGFHQARGETLTELGRHLEATAEFTMAARLATDSKQAMTRLNTAMAKVPGTEITRTEYLQAKEFFRQNEANPTSGGGGWSPGGLGGNGNVWLVPAKAGRSWATINIPVSPPTGNANPSLPTPPYDRLLFRQAVGVPVGKNTLLLDADTIKDALEITVQIDDRTLATAKVTRTGGDGKTPPLTVITVTGYEFTPLGGDKKTTFKAPIAAHVYAANAYEEMGQNIRDAKCKIKAIDAAGNPKVDDKLQAGEAAAAIVTDDGILAGFLAGKTDVTADDGGANKFYPLKDILPLMGGGGSGGWTPGGSGATTTAKPATGKFFLVHIVLGETF